MAFRRPIKRNYLQEISETLTATLPGISINEDGINLNAKLGDPKLLDILIIESEESRILNKSKIVRGRRLAGAYGTVYKMSNSEIIIM